MAAICMKRMILAQGYLQLKTSLLVFDGRPSHREDELEWHSPLQSSLVGHVH